ncbi:carbamoyltransferase [Candidatus Pacearchaeota archaeon]|nr:carbamoyltransferase [Candidatus Pacearchaeota archaeon]
MYILGINPGHNGTAALLKDGKIIACVSEERFSRLKNHVGFPHHSIKYVLEYAKITPQDLQYVVFSTLGADLKSPGKVYNSYRETYTKKPLMKKLFGYMSYKYPSSTGWMIDMKHAKDERNLERMKEKRTNDVARYFNIDKSKIIYTDHHLCHALSTCFNLPSNEKTLVFSLDAEGDGLCATVSVYDGQELKRIASTPKAASLGYLYAIFTVALGMRPNEHEFKVMGLAPYAKKDKVEDVYPLLQKILWVDGLHFKSKFRMQYADSFIDEALKYVRFDTLAASIQKFTEDLTSKWVLNAIEKTSIHNVAFSGGVFMNVKANQRISELKEVNHMFVMPSAGDESTAMGACLYGYKKYCTESNEKFTPQPLKDLYLGPMYDDAYVKNLIQQRKLENGYEITKPKSINKEIAKLLAKGEIVARCSGRSEWGARALGNRSILSNPSNPAAVQVLNETIKDRDFWMPFTPSIIDTDASKYFVNKKKMAAPYMVITFDSTPLARKHLPAAMHSYDFTLRPQVVYKEWNPDYWEIINSFKKLTGIGGVLNTSFNLHGEPNVLTPEDALHTVANSSLKYLALGNYLLKKKS